MKKIAAAFAAFMFVAALVPAPAAAFDLEDLFGKASELGLIPSGNSDFDMAKLAGDWTYKAPAVSFRTDNLLKKAGGAATSALLENKIGPYYKKVGLDRMKLTVNADSTFTMSLPAMKLSGVLQPVAAEKGEPNMKMSFKVLGISALSLDAYVSKPGKTVSITFDAAKLVSLVQFIGKVSGSSTAKALGSLLSAYDGVNAGFELSKTTK